MKSDKAAKVNPAAVIHSMGSEPLEKIRSEEQARIERNKANIVLVGYDMQFKPVYCYRDEVDSPIYQNAKRRLEN